jgi:hypothetical protein
MRLIPRLGLLLALGFAAPACTDPEPTVETHVNALTGAACVPDVDSYMDRRLRTRTTPIDCTGETTDIDHPNWCCKFPQPGCDSNACCDSDIVEPVGPDID